MVQIYMSEPNAVFAIFDLGWFRLQVFYWVVSVLITPIEMVSGKVELWNGGKINGLEEFGW